MDLDDVAVDFPDLTIVIAHIGPPLWYEEALFLLRRHPNMIGDLSSIPPRRIMQVFPRLAEFADRFLWGSDWPAPGVPELGAIVASIRAELPEVVREKILVENPRRLFFAA
jgi:predicted TIM-barrel fold metal-dependent hydrolase